MRLLLHERAWEDYLYWQRTDPKLLRDTMRQPFAGLGKPEPLKHQLVGTWSRRIDQERRLVYMVEADTLIVLQCRLHY